eukprot:scaffold2200_cov240-Ochromonas_danica.AAC.1
MSAMWKLSKDILHSVYGEWLGLKDVSRLDRACVGNKDREAWLSSLIGLKMTTSCESFGRKMSLYYTWLGSRGVFCVEEFPVRLDVLEDLVKEIDLASFCPTIRSLDIACLYYEPLSTCILTESLSIILSHCHHLQELTLALGNDNLITLSQHTSDVVFGVLDDSLRTNSLIKVKFNLWKELRQCYLMLPLLLRKHALSLEELVIGANSNMACIVSTIVENQIRLRVLIVYYSSKTSLEKTESWLMPFLSSAGGCCLETLDVDFDWDFEMNDLLALVAISCPKLSRLVFHGGIIRNRCTEKLRRLYELCPHLRHLTVGRMIETDDESSSVFIEVEGDNEDWAVCLFHALSRTQYDKAILKVRTDYPIYHPVGNLQSMLEPHHQLRLEGCMPEDPLIALLNDLPHLNSLFLKSSCMSVYTDATLVALSKHKKSLIEFDVDTFLMDSQFCYFGDKLLGETILACSLLKILKVPCCGLESLLAVSKHSSLTTVMLFVAENTSREKMNALLLDEEVKLSHTLEQGMALAHGGFIYKVDKELHRWTRIVL